MRPALAFALALPALAQTSVSPGVHLTQYAPDGFTTLGLALTLAPHPYNVLRLRAEASIAASTPTKDGATYANLDAKLVAADYIHYRHGLQEPGLYLGAGVGRFTFSYTKQVPGSPDLPVSDQAGEAHFLLGYQFNGHLAAEGRVGFLSAGELPGPFASLALVAHF